MGLEILDKTDLLYNLSYGPLGGWRNISSYTSFIYEELSVQYLLSSLKRLREYCGVEEHNRYQTLRGGRVLILEVGGEGSGGASRLLAGPQPLHTSFYLETTESTRNQPHINISVLPAITRLRLLYRNSHNF